MILILISLLNGSPTLKDGDYCIKQIEIEYIRRKIETPYKVLAGSGINDQDASSIVKASFRPILEYQKFVSDIRSWISLYRLLTELDQKEFMDSTPFSIKKDVEFCVDNGVSRLSEKPV